MTPTDHHVETVSAETRAVYLSVQRAVAVHERRFSPGVSVDPVASSLSVPLDWWVTSAKSSRVVPALLACEQYVDRTRGDGLAHLLVGLDVFLSSLDEFIDTPDAGGTTRLDLAINAAFGGLLSFGTVPAGSRARIGRTLGEFLVQAARIPKVELAVGRELASVDSTSEAMDLIATAYTVRSRDISAFGRLPALVYGIEEPVATRLVRDLETYRARELLFDDLRDLSEDRAAGIETPVSWFVASDLSRSAVAARLAEIYRGFGYSEAPYCSMLRELEPAPEELTVGAGEAPPSTPANGASPRGVPDP